MRAVVGRGPGYTAFAGADRHGHCVKACIGVADTSEQNHAMSLPSINPQPWNAALPGAMIFLTPVAFDLLADGPRTAKEVKA
jgi:hypothetical protein